MCVCVCVSVMQLGGVPFATTNYDLLYPLRYLSGDCQAIVA